MRETWVELIKLFMVDFDIIFDKTYVELIILVMVDLDVIFGTD